MKRVILIILLLAAVSVGTFVLYRNQKSVDTQNLSSQNIAENPSSELPTDIPEDTNTKPDDKEDQDSEKSANLVVNRDAELLKKIDQLFIIGFRGYTYNTAPELKKAIEETNIGGVILFDYDQATKKYVRNIKTSVQVKTLISDIKKNAKVNNTEPLFISIDEEGGKVSRLKNLPDFTKTASAATLGTKSDADVTTTAAGLGQILKNLGFNVDFAPDIDVNVNPKNPVIGGVDRSFSSDQLVVSQKGIAFFKGLETAGIISAAKHFPGHGSSVADSHLGFVDITSTYKSYELEPFKAACAAGVPMVMVGHLFNQNVDAKHPATLSKTHIDNLKNQAGCKTQLVVSDDMDMGAIIKQYGRTEALTRALNAGIDVLILSNNYATYDPNEFFKARQIILDQVKSGAISESRINNAYQKIQAVKGRYIK